MSSLIDSFGELVGKKKSKAARLLLAPAGCKRYMARYAENMSSVLEGRCSSSISDLTQSAHQWLLLPQRVNMLLAPVIRLRQQLQVEAE